MTYRIKKDEATHYSFLLNDIMAYEQHPGHGISVEDVKLVLSGHVLEGYKVTTLRFGLFFFYMIDK